MDEERRNQERLSPMAMIAAGFAAASLLLSVMALNLNIARTKATDKTIYICPYYNEEMESEVITDA